MSKIKVLSFALLALSIGILFTTKVYTKVNATSTALLINFIMLPCTIFETILFVFLFFSKKKKTIIIIQAALFIFLLYWLLDYTLIKQ
jgi:hypothetical protein